MDFGNTGKFGATGKGLSYGGMEGQRLAHSKFGPHQGKGKNFAHPSPGPPYAEHAAQGEVVAAWAGYTKGLAAGHGRHTPVG